MLSAHLCNMEQALAQNDDSDLSRMKPNQRLNVEIRLQDWLEVDLHHCACHATYTNTQHYHYYRVRQKNFLPPLCRIKRYHQLNF